MTRGTLVRFFVKQKKILRNPHMKAVKAVRDGANRVIGPRKTLRPQQMQVEIIKEKRVAVI